MDDMKHTLAGAVCLSSYLHTLLLLSVIDLREW